MSDRSDSYSTVPFAPARHVYMDSLALGHRKHTVHGLFEVDVTHAREILHAHKNRTGERLSFTAFLLSCLGRAIAENKEMHAYRNWRRQLVLFDDVDITTMIEVEAGGRRLPLAHVIRATNRRTIRDIHDEIRSVQSRSERGQPHPLWRFLPLYPWIPGPLRRLVYRIALKSPQRMKKYVGTVILTAVGMYGRGGGWAITWPLYTLGVAVGGIATRPALIDGRLEDREYLSITVSVDHDIVDGAPIARFAQRLMDLIESGEGLDEATGA